MQSHSKKLQILQIAIDEGIRAGVDEVIRAKKMDIMRKTLLKHTKKGTWDEVKELRPNLETEMVKFLG